MSGLVDNLMDFARGRLGGGLPLDRNANEPLAPALEQVVAELRSGWPDRHIDARIETDEPPVHCDRARIAQLLSNLLANALTHGSASTPVSVLARVQAGTFELSVANQGDPIPAAVIDRLLEPFYRQGGGGQGLGLGLYIASEIARAHGGALTVASGPQETRFTFRMPAAVSQQRGNDGAAV